MMKKLNKILFLVFCIFLSINVTHAETLKHLKDELAKDEKNQSAIIERQKTVQKNINAAKDEIKDLEDTIEKSEKQIEDILVKIDELNEDITNKKQEIDSLLSFLQISEGDNIYLEYVFQAKSFTDFIYRSAIVEELTEYNDKLIDEMYDMIEENKRLQVELQDKIAESESNIDALDKKLASYNVSLKDLENQHTDVASEIKERKKTIEYYEKIYKENDCEEDEELVACMTDIPNSSGMVRPTKSGTISSEWGYRNCPFHGREIHSGIDIAVSMGTTVYAAAPGKVVGITRKSSCGGNIVTILHNIKGKSYRTRYMHLSAINVSMGNYVNIDTVIGKSGGGGYTLKRNGGWDTCSTGAHLHFMVLPGEDGSKTVNPRGFVTFPKKGGRFTSRW